MSKLLSLLDARRQWLDTKSTVHAKNISRSDIKGSFRDEVSPFKSYLTHYNKGASHTDLQQRNVRTTKQFAKRDEEMLHMHRTGLEHEAVITMINNFHKMMRSAINNSGS